MIVEKFATLPGWIDHQGINFKLQLIVNGRPDDVRLCYAIDYVEKESQYYQAFTDHGCWINPFNGNSQQGFLFLIENIKTDDDLIQAIDECHEFLKSNDLK